MKIYIPFETVAKSLFVAKNKKNNDFKLVFCTRIKKKPLFFAYRELIFNSKPLNDEQLADLEFYPITSFLNQLLDLIYASKDIDKLAFSRLSELKDQAEAQEGRKLDVFDDILTEVKIEREISHGLDLFLDDFNDLIKNNDVKPISHKDIVSNFDKYQIALAWAFFKKDIESLIFRGINDEINDFVRTFLYSMSHPQRANDFVFNISIIEYPRKTKLLLRLNTFEKIKSYFGALA